MKQLLIFSAADALNCHIKFFPVKNLLFWQKGTLNGGSVCPFVPTCCNMAVYLHVAQVQYFCLTAVFLSGISPCFVFSAWLDPQHLKVIVTDFLPVAETAMSNTDEKSKHCHSLHAIDAKTFYHLFWTFLLWKHWHKLL